MPSKKLLKGYQEFKKEFELERDKFHVLAEKGQSPKVLWFGCSDSRVVPEVILNADPGDIFVHRNIGNIIPPPEAKQQSAAAVLEFALDNLGVEYIAVCGHTDCGAVKAILEHGSEPPNSDLFDWLNFGARPQFEKIGSSENEISDLAKKNVLLQVENLLKYDVVIKKLEKDEIKIVAWIYDLHSGLITNYNYKTGKWEIIE